MTDRLWLVLLDYPMLLPECVVVRFIKIIDHSNLGHCQLFAFKGPWRSNPDSSLPLQFVGKCSMEFRLWLRPIRDYSFYPRTILIHSLEFDRCWPISGVIFVRNNFSNWSITTTLSIHRLRSKIGPNSLVGSGMEFAIIQLTTEKLTCSPLTIITAEIALVLVRFESLSWGPILGMEYQCNAQWIVRRAIRTYNGGGCGFCGGSVGGDRVENPPIGLLRLRRGKLKVSDEIFNFLVDYLLVAYDEKQIGAFRSTSRSSGLGALFPQGWPLWVTWS